VKNYKWIDWNVKNEKVPWNAVQLKIENQSYVIRSRKNATLDYFYGYFNSIAKVAHIVKNTGNQYLSNFEVINLTNLPTKIISK
jgi:hypothetical protein